MCIICNCNELGDRFLMTHRQASHHMEHAKEIMLQCYKDTGIKSYDRAHKHMTRVLKEWNKTEHIREAKPNSEES